MVKWLPGSAFLSWARMGNLQKWMGPPSVQWMENQRQLAVQILDRMEELWMEPVLPAFAGFLPGEFSEKYPNQVSHFRLVMRFKLGTLLRIHRDLVRVDHRDVFNNLFSTSPVAIFR